MNTQTVVYCMTAAGVEPPAPATPEAAGMDLQSTDEVLIRPGETATIGTGVRVELPYNHCLLILSRSGLAKRGIVVANAPGLIDPDYRGEIKVLLRNVRAHEPYQVSVGDRIAQALMVEFRAVSWVQCEELSETDRGDAGIGSTGV